MASAVVGAREKLEILTAYAPRVWFHSAEQFFPSPVEWAFPHQIRSTGSDGNFWLSSIENLVEPSSLLGFFAGCNEVATSAPCALSDTPVYAFWVEKRDSAMSEEYIDLIYFFYYPFQ